MDVLDDIGVSKLSGKVFFSKVKYSLNSLNVDKVILSLFYKSFIESVLNLLLLPGMGASA